MNTFITKHFSVKICFNLITSNENPLVCKHTQRSSRIQKQFDINLQNTSTRLPRLFSEWPLGTHVVLEKDFWLPRDAQFQNDVLRGDTGLLRETDPLQRVAFAQTDVKQVAQTGLHHRRVLAASQRHATNCVTLLEDAKTFQERRIRQNGWPWKKRTRSKSRNKNQ